MILRSHATYNKQKGHIDPRIRPRVTAGSDNYFCTCRPFVHPSVRPSVCHHFSKQNKFQAKTVFTTGKIVGLAERIIDDTCLVSGYSVSCKIFIIWLEKAVFGIMDMDNIDPRAWPKSWPVVITNFTQVVRTYASVHSSQIFKIKQKSLPAGNVGWPSGSLMSGVLYILSSLTTGMFKGAGWWFEFFL